MCCYALIYFHSGDVLCSAKKCEGGMCGLAHLHSAKMTPYCLKNHQILRRGGAGAVAVLPGPSRRRDQETRIEICK